MRIGIFGDSFAGGHANFVGIDFLEYGGEEFGRDRWNNSWPIKLVNDIKFAGKTRPPEVGHHSGPGTSEWWSFNQFLEHHHKYDVIIFAHTSEIRIPHLPPGLEGKAWFVPSTVYEDPQEHKTPAGEGLHRANKKVIQQNSEVLPFHDGYEKLFTPELLEFIFISCVKNLEEICKKKNIFLIHLFSFLSSRKSLNFLPELEINYNNLYFSSITGLNDVSQNEVTFEIIKKLREETTFNNSGDYRYNHLNKPNNILLSTILQNLIEEKTLNTHKDFYNDFRWHKRDDDLVMFLEKTFK